MGDGYGSECHLLRYMGRHRDTLDRAILAATGGSSIKWLDYPFDKSRRWLDGEWTGLSFLPKNSAARHAWTSWWPQSGKAQNWDAVGKIGVGGRDEYGRPDLLATKVLQDPETTRARQHDVEDH